MLILDVSRSIALKNSNDKSKRSGKITSGITNLSKDDQTRDSSSTFITSAISEDIDHLSKIDAETASSIPLFNVKVVKPSGTPTKRPNIKNRILKTLALSVNDDDIVPHVCVRGCCHPPHLATIKRDIECIKLALEQQNEHSIKAEIVKVEAKMLENEKVKEFKLAKWRVKKGLNELKHTLESALAKVAEEETELKSLHRIGVEKHAELDGLEKEIGKLQDELSSERIEIFRALGDLVLAKESVEAVINEKKREINVMVSEFQYLLYIHNTFRYLPLYRLM
jgi:hypothetical protein